MKVHLTATDNNGDIDPCRRSPASSSGDPQSLLGSLQRRQNVASRLTCCCNCGLLCGRLEARHEPGPRQRLCFSLAALPISTQARLQRRIRLLCGDSPAGGATGSQTDWHLLKRVVAAPHRDVLPSYRRRSQKDARALSETGVGLSFYSVPFPQRSGCSYGPSHQRARAPACPPARLHAHARTHASKHSVRTFIRPKTSEMRSGIAWAAYAPRKRKCTRRCDH